jgi:hypothetical protein
MTGDRKKNSTFSGTNTMEGDEHDQKWRKPLLYAVCENKIFNYGESRHLEVSHRYATCSSSMPSKLHHF